MPTQCSRDLFGYEVVEGRQVVAAFDGGEVTSDAGALLLGATDRAIGLVARFAACFDDGRVAGLVEHSVAAMVAQRIFGIALGYEDLIDHDQLRHDPVLATLAGKLVARRKNCAPLAGKSTLNRLEHAPSGTSRYHKIGHDPAAIEGLFVDLFLDSQITAPRRIILDLDATDDPLHGHQEGRFFHGYYDCYCYLPLYVFCGRHLLAAKLRRANIDASAGAVTEVERIVHQIRMRWPRVAILLRADSGFAREELMSWCEVNGVDYLFGLARNERLVGQIADDLAAVAAESLAQGSPARRFADFVCWAAGTGLGPRSPTRRPSARQLEPPTPRRRQGRAPDQGLEPALCRHLAAGERDRRPPPLRGRLLRPRRGREPDQGAATRAVRRPHLRRDHAR
jgi:Transposase DDE domain group 1